MQNRISREQSALGPGGFFARLLFSGAGLAGIVMLSRFLG